VRNSGVRKWWIWWLIITPVPLLLYLLIPRAAPQHLSLVDHPSNQLIAAIGEARHKLPDFIAALKARKPDDRFAIKGLFKTPMGNEYLWVKNVTVQKGGFSGTLDQVPIAFKEKQKGDSVTVSNDNVVDWYLRHNGQTTGGFTEKISP